MCRTLWFVCPTSNKDQIQSGLAECTALVADCSDDFSTAIRDAINEISETTNEYLEKNCTNTGVMNR